MAFTHSVEFIHSSGSELLTMHLCQALGSGCAGSQWDGLGRVGRKPNQGLRDDNCSWAVQSPRETPGLVFVLQCGLSGLGKALKGRLSQRMHLTGGKVGVQRKKGSHRVRKVGLASCAPDS